MRAKGHLALASPHGRAVGGCATRAQLAAALVEDVLAAAPLSPLAFAAVPPASGDEELDSVESPPVEVVAESALLGAGREPLEDERLSVR